MQQAFDMYEQGTVGNVSIGAVVRSLTGGWQNKLGWSKLTHSISGKADLLSMSRQLQEESLQM